jgi:hypothetical protein
MSAIGEHYSIALDGDSVTEVNGDVDGGQGLDFLLAALSWMLLSCTLPLTAVLDLPLAADGLTVDLSHL